MEHPNVKKLASTKLGNDNFDFRLKSLLYLVEIENTGSQADASEKLGVTQSAISQNIEAMEQDWGIQIFEAKGKTRVLTEAGRALADYANEVVGRTFEVRDWLHSLREGKQGILKVGMIDSANLYILPSALSEFRKKFADVELHLVIDSSQPLFERLANFKLDLVFVNYIPVDERYFNVIDVVTEPLFLYSPKGLDAKTGPWALYPPGSITRQMIDHKFYDEGIDPNISLESSNPKILSQMVQLGFCNAVLPAGEASEEIAPLKCRKIAERRLVALTRKTSPNDTRAQSLIEFALNKCSLRNKTS